LAIERDYEVNKAFFQDLHYYYPEVEKRTEVEIGGKFWKHFLQIVKKGIREGVFKDDILPEIALEGISVLYKAVARNGQFRKFPESQYEILLNTITIYIRGFCTQKGILDLEEYFCSFYLPEQMHRQKRMTITLKQK